MTTRTAEELVDLTRAIEGATWVTVAEAARATAIDEATVRSWSASGRVPSQRTGVDDVLVPMEAVQALATGDAELADGFRSEVIDLNAGYWSSEAEAARVELGEARARLASLESQHADLVNRERAARAQIAELEADNAVLRASLDVAPTVLQHAEDECLPQRDRGRRRPRR